MVVFLTKVGVYRSNNVARAAFLIIKFDSSFGNAAS